MTQTRAATVPEMLRNAAEIYEERNKLYGDNYKRFGPIMALLFPDGLTLETGDDHNRFGIFVQMLAKFTRYAQNFEKGGHPDSLDDLAVYSMMLQELDSEEVATEADVESYIGYLRSKCASCGHPAEAHPVQAICEEFIDREAEATHSETIRFVAGEVTLPFESDADIAKRIKVCSEDPDLTAARRVGPGRVCQPSDTLSEFDKGIK